MRCVDRTWTLYVNYDSVASFASHCDIHTRRRDQTSCEMRHPQSELEICDGSDDSEDALESFMF